MSNIIVSGSTKASVKRREALRYMGYRGQLIDAPTDERIDEIITLCEENISATYVWADFEVDATGLDGSGEPCIIIVGTSLVFYGSHIFRKLKAAARCALFAVTLGAQSEQELVRLNAIDPIGALIFDAACSSLVEDAAGIVQSEIDDQAKQRGLSTDSRYSPGYGDFSLDIQSEFLNCLCAQQRLGLTVTADNLLIPTKSITAVVGMYENIV